MADVIFSQVRKRYGEVEVVHGIDLHIRSGEFIVFVGPSGCGKSTLLRMVAGLEAITEGEMRIGERRVNELPPRERDIAMVFQDYALYPHKTVQENMSFGLHLRKLPEPEVQRRVQEAAETLQITHLLDRLPKALSGGQRQRVAMGRAIVRQPQLFLFDEPLSNLDALLRNQVRGEIKKLHQRLRQTIIYVTHDQVEAMTLADRIVVLHAGRIMQVGTPDEIYGRPQHRFVAGFTGSPPMNFLPATVTAEGGGNTLRIADAATLVLPEALARQARGHAGRGVDFGIRPENLHLGAAHPDWPRLEATVDLVEPLGAENLLTLALGPHELKARLAPQVRPAPGTRERGAGPGTVPPLRPGHRGRVVNTPLPPRLHPLQLPRLPEAVARPRYDRTALRAGIVHLGVGAFQRAHMGAATEAALHAHGDLRWGIVGVSLRHPYTRDALAPQQGLYTLALRDAAADGRPREALQVIGNLLEVLVAPEDPGQVLDRIAHVHTCIVSLTVTEKGYCHDPATLALRWDHPDITHDLTHPAAPRSAIGLLVHGLQRRRAAGRGPLTLMSLDNLPSNGHVLRGLVSAFAARVDPALQAWIAEGCRFPNSMVDRIVPRTTDADRAAIATTLGCQDAWPVLGEPFFDWAIEDDFAAGRPDWTAGGARFVAEAAPEERRKLRMVNGTHSALAYLGAMAGWPTVDRAVAEPALRHYLLRLMREEIEPTLAAEPEATRAAYRERLLQRYANPALQHQTRQIAMDGSQKLPQRLLGTAADLRAQGRQAPLLALAIAAWLHYLRGRDDAGNTFTIDDPQAPTLAAALAQARAGGAYDLQPLAAAMPPLAPLVADAPIAAMLARHWRTLDTQGAAAVLRGLEA